MSFTKGTTAVKIINLNSIVVGGITIDADNILDGVSFMQSAGTSQRMASGIDRVTDEKLIVSFDIVEITAANAASLLALAGAEQDIAISLTNGNNIEILDTYLSINRKIKSGEAIAYTVSTETVAYDIDDIATYE